MCGSVIAFSFAPEVVPTFFVHSEKFFEVFFIAGFKLFAGVVPIAVVVVAFSDEIGSFDSYCRGL